MSNVSRRSLPMSRLALAFITGITASAAIFVLQGAGVQIARSVSLVAVSCLLAVAAIGVAVRHLIAGAFDKHGLPQKTSRDFSPAYPALSFVLRTCEFLGTFAAGGLATAIVVGLSLLSQKAI